MTTIKDREIMAISTQGGICVKIKFDDFEVSIVLDRKRSSDEFYKPEILVFHNTTSDDAFCDTNMTETFLGQPAGYDADDLFNILRALPPNLPPCGDDLCANGCTVCKDD